VGREETKKKKKNTSVGNLRLFMRRTGIIREKAGSGDGLSGGLVQTFIEKGRQIVQIKEKFIRRQGAKADKKGGGDSMLN